MILRFTRDESEWKRVLQDHLIHVRHIVSSGAEILFSKFKENFPLPDEFLTYLFALSGMEIEGEEISMGFLYSNSLAPSFIRELPDAKLGKWLLRDLRSKVHFGIPDFATYRWIIREIRSELIGWTTGRFLEPLLVLTGTPPQISGIKILWGKGNIPPTAHQTYSKLTETSDTLAIWIKPTASIRLYKKGSLFGQIMRLRDAGGWTTRHISRISEIVKQVSQYVGLNIDDDICRILIVEPCISMSESRRGCTIAVLKKDFFKQLESNWQDEKKIGCKAKHSPTQEEQEHPPTEMEYENYLAQDGIVVITPTGQLLGMGTYFRGGPGGRRDTAAWLPRVVGRCLTIVTSQDGPMYLFWPKEPNDEGIRSSLGEVDGVRLDFIPREDSKAIERKLD